MQADPNKKNMERMEERVPHADEQRLQHMLSDSPWDHRAVIDRVALEADGLIGGERNGGLLIDESGFKKSGSHSVGVARQGCGRLGKVDNCQVGVFAALGGDRRVILVDERLYLPEKWTDEPPRCEQAAIPEAVRRFKTKVALALERVAPQRRLGVRFSWVGADGFYGTDPAFLRGLEAMGEVWVADGHCDQRIFLEDPKPTPKERKARQAAHEARGECAGDAGRAVAIGTAARGMGTAQGSRRQSRRAGSGDCASTGLVMGWRGERGALLAFDCSPRGRCPGGNRIYPFECARRDRGAAVGRNAGAALWGGASVSGR